MDLVQRVRLWELSQRGHTAQLSHHVSPHVVGGQLVTLEVRAANPDLSQQPITAIVRGQEDRVLRTGCLLQLRKTKSFIHSTMYSHVYSTTFTATVQNIGFFSL